MSRWLLRLFYVGRRKLMALGKLLIESTAGNNKRKILQYSAYLLILIVMNFFVGKNMANSRYAWYSNVSIFLLVNINIILMLVLMLVIFRSLAKVLSEAHSNIFGARLKVKLVLFSVMTTVIPVSVFFFFAVTLVNNSINKWFDSQIDSALVSSVELMEDYQKMVRQDLFDQTLLISQVITDKRLYNRSESELLDNFIQNYVGKNLVMGIAVYNSRGTMLMSQDNIEKGYLNVLSKNYLASILKGNQETGYEFIGEDQIYWAAVPLTNISDNKTKVYGGLITYRVTPKKIADDIDLIQESRDTYRESAFFSFPIKKAYFMMLILMAMLVMFAGIWGSILFAGGITKPIEALADASVEISRGNLDVSIKEQGSDEISYLIRTFNRMTRQLSVHTKELHSKNEILSEMYSQISRDNMYIDAMFRNVDSAVILFSHDLKPLKSNEKAAHLLRGDREVLRARVFETTKNFMQSGENEFFENIEVTLDDENRLYSLSLSKISSAEEEQTLLVLDDITDIVNAERINVWKEVATRIAHEVKNPLTPIKLVAERVKKRSHELHDSKIKEIISESMDTIVTEADNLLELVEEFNLFARLPKAKKYPMDMGQLVTETAALYTQTYPHIAFSVEQDGDLMVNCDRLQLRRVFHNIISNAVSAVKQDGKINITASGSNATNVTITISDNGIGIKQEDLFKVFEPYFSKRSGGTGLGLAIVKKIIEEHDGKISAESGQDSGTQFTITLPRGA